MSLKQHVAYIKKRRRLKRAGFFRVTHDELVTDGFRFKPGEQRRFVIARKMEAPYDGQIMPYSVDYIKSHIYSDFMKLSDRACGYVMVRRPRGG